jgi:hypothetical protein
MLSLWSDKSEFLALFFLWLVMCELVHTLYLSLVLNNHLPVTALGLCLFLGIYLTNNCCVVSSDREQLGLKWQSPFFKERRLPPNSISTDVHQHTPTNVP